MFYGSIIEKGSERKRETERGQERERERDLTVVI